MSSMHLPFSGLIALLVSLILTNPASAAPPIGSIGDLIGIVHVRHDGDSTWRKARPKMRVFDGDAIATKAESRCEIVMTGDRVVRVDENALLVIGAADTVSATVNALKGKLWVNVKKLAGRSFEVTTPTATAAIRGTVFGVECNQNAAKYFVLRGAVAVAAGKDGDSVFMVKAGRQIDLVKDLDLYLEEQKEEFAGFISEEEDAFEKFQKQEETALEDYEEEQEARLNAMLAEERKAFSPVNGINCALRNIDQSRLTKSDFVQWNRELDKALGW